MYVYGFNTYIIVLTLELWVHIVQERTLFYSRTVRRHILIISQEERIVHKSNIKHGL